MNFLKFSVRKVQTAEGKGWSVSSKVELVDPGGPEVKAEGDEA